MLAGMECRRFDYSSYRPTALALLLHAALELKKLQSWQSRIGEHCGNLGKSLVNNLCCFVAFWDMSQFRFSKDHFQA